MRPDSVQMQRLLPKMSGDTDSISRPYRHKPVLRVHLRRKRCSDLSDPTIEALRRFNGDGFSGNQLKPAIFTPIHARAVKSTGLQCSRNLNEIRGSSMKTIHHTDTLVYHDGAQVFAARDDAGSSYLDVLTESLGDAVLYAVVEVPAERIESVRVGAPDLKTLLIEESKDGWYLAQAHVGLADPLALQEQDGSITDAELSSEDDFVLGVLSVMVFQQRYDMDAARAST